MKGRLRVEYRDIYAMILDAIFFVDSSNRLLETMKYGFGMSADVSALRSNKDRLGIAISRHLPAQFCCLKCPGTP